MNILQINDRLKSFGGSESVFRNTIKVLEDKGDNVSVLGGQEPGYTSEANEYIYDYSSSIKKRIYAYKLTELIEEIIKKENLDLAHIHNIAEGISFSILPLFKKHKIPVIATIHDWLLICPTFNMFDKQNNLCEKCLGGKYYNCFLKNCDARGRIGSLAKTIKSYYRDRFFPFTKLIDELIFVSDFSKEKFLQIFPSITQHAHTIHNFTHDFNKEPYKGEYFLFFGRLSPEKGLNTLVKSFNMNSNLKLKIVGAGNQEQFLRENINHNIELYGFKTGYELKNIIQKASFIIVPSESNESNSMVIVESYALGKPIISSRIGSLPELILEGKTGFTFTPKNHVELSELINKCSELDDDEYKNLSDNAFNYAASNFSPDIYYKNLMEVYDRTLKQRN